MVATKPVWISTRARTLTKTPRRRTVPGRMSHERGLDDHHRQQLAIGAVTLAEAIHNVGDLLVRLADLLVPDFADLMVAADVATGTTTPALVRPDGDEARKLLDWVAPLYDGLVERWLAPRLYATGLGLSVIVVPVLEGGGGRSRHVLALGRRADRPE